MAYVGPWQCGKGAWKVTCPEQDFFQALSYFDLMWQSVLHSLVFVNHEVFLYQSHTNITHTRSSHTQSEVYPRVHSINIPCQKNTKVPMTMQGKISYDMYTLRFLLLSFHPDQIAAVKQQQVIKAGLWCLFMERQSYTNLHASVVPSTCMPGNTKNYDWMPMWHTHIQKKPTPIQRSLA